MSVISDVYVAEGPPRRAFSSVENLFITSARPVLNPTVMKSNGKPPHSKCPRNDDGSTLRSRAAVLA